MRRILGVLAVFTLLSGTGCASVVGTGYTEAKIPYVGTIVDGCAVCTVGSHPALALAGLVDLPLSMAVDTVLLPVTLTRYAAK